MNKRERGSEASLEQYCELDFNRFSHAEVPCAPQLGGTLHPGAYIRQTPLDLLASMGMLASDTAATVKRRTEFGDQHTAARHMAKADLHY